MPITTQALAATAAGRDTSVNFDGLSPEIAYLIVGTQTNQTNTDLMLNKASDIQDRNKRINELRVLKTRLQACNPDNKTGDSWEPLSGISGGTTTPGMPHDTRWYDSVKLLKDLRAAGFDGVEGDTVRTENESNGNLADATFDQMNTWLSQISNQIDSLTSTTSTDAIYLQKYLGTANNAVEQASAVMKKTVDAKEAVVRNF